MVETKLKGWLLEAWKHSKNNAKTVPAPSKGWRLNPKGLLISGTPTPIHLAPRKEGPGWFCEDFSSVFRYLLNKRFVCDFV